jgi:hypothetical protein
LLLHCANGKEINEIQLPVSCDAVAIGVLLIEVIAGVQEENRNIGPLFTNEMQKENILGLEAAGKACIIAAGGSRQFSDEEFANLCQFCPERGRQN